MLYTTTCDNCKKEIEIGEYNDNKGLCDECVRCIQ